MSAPEETSATARRLGSQSLIVLAGNVFTLAVGLPLQILVSRTLGAGGLGVFGLIEGAVNTANGLLNFGLAQTAVRFIPAHLEKGESGYVRSFLRFAIVTLVAVGCGGYLILLAALPFLAGWWPELEGYSAIVALAGLLLPLGLLMFLLQQALRGFQEIRYMVLGSSILQLTVKAVATVAAFAAGLHLLGYVLATVIAVAFGVFWMALGLVRRLRDVPAPSGDLAPPPMAEWRRYAAISYGNGLLGTATGNIDRFLLAAFAGNETVGVLLVLRQLQQIPLAFNQMLLMVGAPMFAAAHARGDVAGREHLYVTMTDWLMKASLPLIIFMFIFDQPVLHLFGPQFARDGVEALWILLIGQTVNLACGPVGTIALMSGLEAIVIRLAAYNMVLSAALLVVLAPTMGLIGVAVATAVTTVFINLAVMAVVRRRLSLRWWNRRFLGWVLPSCAAAALGLGISYGWSGGGVAALAAALAVMYAVFGAAALLQGLNEDEKDLLRHLTNRILGRASA